MGEASRRDGDRHGRDQGKRPRWPRRTDATTRSSIARSISAKRCLELTDGKGVNVVYDSVGKDTFDTGIDVLAERGWMVSFGQSSGPAPALNTARLAMKAKHVTRGGLYYFVKDPEVRARNAAELFGLIADGVLKVEINQRYPLSDAARAHTDLEARKTTGSTILTP